MNDKQRSEQQQQQRNSGTRSPASLPLLPTPHRNLGHSSRMSPTNDDAPLGTQLQDIIDTLRNLVSRMDNYVDSGIGDPIVPHTSPLAILSAPPPHARFAHSPATPSHYYKCSTQLGPACPENPKACFTGSKACPSSMRGQPNLGAAVFDLHGVGLGNTDVISDVQLVSSDVILNCTVGSGGVDDVLDVLMDDT